MRMGAGSNGLARSVQRCPESGVEVVVAFDQVVELTALDTDVFQTTIGAGQPFFVIEPLPAEVELRFRANAGVVQMSVVNTAAAAKNVRVALGLLPDYAP